MRYSARPSPHLWYTSKCISILHTTAVPVTLCKEAVDTSTSTVDTQWVRHHLRTHSIHTTLVSNNHAKLSVHLMCTHGTSHTTSKIPCSAARIQSQDINMYKSVPNHTYIRMYVCTYTQAQVHWIPAISDKKSFEWSRERSLQADSCCPLWGRDAWMPAGESHAYHRLLVWRKGLRVHSPFVTLYHNLWSVYWERHSRGMLETNERITHTDCVVIPSNDVATYITPAHTKHTVKSR